MPVDDQGLIRRPRRTPVAPALLLLAGIAFQAPAQELEPRTYSPNPVGANFLVVGYSRSTGEVLFESTVPLSDVDTEFNAVTVAFEHTFGAFGRAANVLVLAPYVWGDVSGNVGEEAESITRSGPGDPRLRLSINLAGGPALTPAEFAHRKPTTTLGASLTVVPPLGQYDSTRLINIGANRRSFKPELGVSYPVGRWYLEGYAGDPEKGLKDGKLAFTLHGERCLGEWRLIRTGGRDPEEKQEQWFLLKKTDEVSEPGMDLPAVHPTSVRRRRLRRSSRGTPDRRDAGDGVLGA